MTSPLEVYRLTFAMLGVLGLALGVLGLMLGRPIILKSRWLLRAALSLLVPDLLAIFFGWPARDPRFGGEVQLLTYSLVLGMVWVGLGGYLLLGVTPTAVKEALQHALVQLGLSYERRGSTFIIQSESFELETSVQSLIGTAKVHARKDRGRVRLDEVAALMAAYFTTHPVGTNRTIYGYCITGGTILLVAALALSFAHAPGVP